MSLTPSPLLVAGVPVLFVMAAEAEYGPALRSRIRPLMTGVGPVEAAVSLTAALSVLGARQALPQLIVSLGSAGSRRLPQAAVFQVGSVSWRDMDASPLGFEPGRTPFLDWPAEVPLPHRIPGLAVARLSTGANIVSGAGYDRIDADMVDMETFALLRAADRFGIPLIGLRGISDGAEDLRGYADWTALLGQIDRALADALDLLDAALADGDIAL
ncbi:adenosylhomocysteine nucleosidase [Gemmobacter megaterium]|uniref:Adenosylhomocysteine nucleosidase n=1 Tax=Gemmobacter megaterium TaxID=1086013 RepID=A0A1N7KUR4_9RHOB|nr:5'-methylthioadenosine/S-adenosylhomocysteine nucleosidase [Gemmobacter megaterium]GGE03867.1 5'-methylthioadenosine/S-adenosylhomocysteine nucleosidase [Gemmobacter megaterium]SIS65150.1 adenosylhomocysteine nucleosidase [Gemmobacter megaterium]